MNETDSILESDCWRPDAIICLVTRSSISCSSRIFRFIFVLKEKKECFYFPKLKNHIRGEYMSRGWRREKKVTEKRSHRPRASYILENQNPSRSWIFWRTHNNWLFHFGFVSCSSVLNYIFYINELINIVVMKRDQNWIIRFCPSARTKVILKKNNNLGWKKNVKNDSCSFCAC